MNATSQAVPRPYLGGSDAAAAVNLSRYKSPLRLYQEKRGEVEEEDLSDNERVYFGTLLEEVVATEFARRTQVRVMREHRYLAHPQHDYLVAHIDRRVVGVREGLECKTADLRMAKEWGEEDTDSVPMEYLAQCVHYLAVTGWQRWHVALLLGGNSFRIYRIDRDEELIEALIAKERAFWKCVLEGTPPPPTTVEDLRVLYPRDSGDLVMASSQIAQTVAKLKTLKALAKHNDSESEACEIAIKAVMKTATTLLDAEGKPLCTWKAQTARRVDVTRLRLAEPELAAAFEHAQVTRVLRIK